MAVRIQFRRGTAAEWTAANTVLAAGELGYETDTSKFKFGDGSTAWNSLGYGGVSQADIDSAVANVIDLAPNTLDTLNELADSIGDDPNFAETVSNNIAAAEANAAAYTNSVATSITANVNSYTDNAVANLLDSAPGTLDTLNELASALGDDPNFATTITNDLANKVDYEVDTSSNFQASNPVTSANTLYFESDFPSYLRVGDGTTNYNDLSWVGKDYTETHVANEIFDHNQETTSVHGIANTADLVTLSALSTHGITGLNDIANTQTVSDLDNTLGSHQEATTNVHGIANTSDLLITSDLTNHANLTQNVHGIADTTQLVVNEDLLIYATKNDPTFTGEINAGAATSVDLPVNTTIGNVGGAKLEFSANVTSDIQEQLDDKAPLNSPAFTGTVTGINATMIGLDQVDNTADTDKPISNAVQDALDLKADLDSPTFTGTVVLPATTTIGNVSTTELEALNGVTSDIQTQLNSKLNSATAASTYAPLTSPTFTGTVSLPATTSVGNVSATELQHLANVTSDVQSQLDDKAPTDNPTFTGTVSGIDKTMVGLTNVDNTSDLDKPVSNATQSALDAKLSLSGGTMTGKITLDADPTQALHAATKQYVDSAEAGLSTKPQVLAATTGNLSATYDNGTAGEGATLNLGQLATLNIDGVTSWELLDGVLVKDQTNAAENGRYVVDQIGNDTDTDWILRRCSLCDTADEIPGAYIFVIDGTANEQTGWVLHVDDPSTFTVGTDDIDVYQFAGAGAVTAGTNIEVSGTQVSVVSNPTFANVVTASSGVEFSDGTVQTSAGVPSLTSFTEKTASYTLDTLDHQDNVVEMNSASATTFTIPTDAALAWPVGASMDIFQMGSGQVTVAGDTGVTVLFTPGNKLRTQYSSCTIMKRGANSWVLYGDLTA